MTTRRRFLHAGALTAGLTAIPAVPARGGTSDRPAFVFVPGSHGSAQYLSPLTTELTLRGYPAVTVDLPGHGVEADFPAWYAAPQDLNAMATTPSTIASVTLADATQRVITVVRRLARHTPVVLVGHSLGGATIGAAGNAIPDLIHRLVYLSAFCLAGLPTVADYVLTPENAGNPLSDPTLIAAPLTVGALRVNWRTRDPIVLSKLRDAYLDDGTDAQLRAVIGGLQPDESLRLSIDNGQVDPHTWGRIPRSYIIATGDRGQPVPLQHRMINDADALTPHNRFDVHELAMTHLGLVLNPQPVADLLTRLHP